MLFELTEQDVKNDFQCLPGGKDVRLVVPVNVAHATAKRDVTKGRERAQGHCQHCVAAHR